MIEEKTIHTVVEAVKHIIQDEHAYNFEVYAVDDREYIPRMERIADSIADFFFESGVPRSRCRHTRNELLEYARQLYVAEWMKPDPYFQSDHPPRAEDAIATFNSHLI